MSSDIKPRTYGNRWSPVAEDPARCVESVWCDTRRAHFQCDNKRGKGTGGLYCGTHDPERRAEKQRKREALREAERKLRIESDPLTIARKRIEALEGEVADKKAFILEQHEQHTQNVNALLGSKYRAEARAERLRVALAEIVSHEVSREQFIMQGPAYAARVVSTVISIARKALEGDKQ